MTDGTRLLNLLGVEEDEKFTTKITCFTFRVHRGLFQYEDCSGNWQTATCSTLCELIDDPTLIIRKPQLRYTDEEMTFLRLLRKYGKVRKLYNGERGNFVYTSNGKLVDVNINELLKHSESLDLDEMFGAEE